MGVKAFSTPGISAKKHVNSNTNSKTSAVKKFINENHKLLGAGLAVATGVIRPAVPIINHIYSKLRSRRINLMFKRYMNSRRELEEILDTYSNLIKNVNLCEIS